MSTYTMSYSTASGVTGIGGSQGYIPEIWSGKFVEKFYKTTIFTEISNTDYEGEITAYGDKVEIRIIPDITVSDYVIGQPLNYERPTVSLTELLIDKGKYYATSINKVEQKQSDLNYVDTWGSDAAEQMKIKIDSSVLGNSTETGIFGSAKATTNRGSAAGADSADINLGITTSPIILTKTNIIDKLLEFQLVLDESDAPETGRWVILPPWAIQRLKASDIKDASLTGDGVSVLRNGRVGVIDRFTIYSSRQLPAGASVSGLAAGETGVYFGHMSTITFATQMVENETLPNPNDFGDLMRGLQVYGFKVLKSDMLGQAIVAKS